MEEAVFRLERRRAGLEMTTLRRALLRVVVLALVDRARRTAGFKPAALRVDSTRALRVTWAPVRRICSIAASTSP